MSKVVPARVALEETGIFQVLKVVDGLVHWQITAREKRGDHGLRVNCGQSPALEQGHRGRVELRVEVSVQQSTLVLQSHVCSLLRTERTGLGDLRDARLHIK